MIDTFIVLFVIGVILYKMFKSDSSTPRESRRRQYNSTQTTDSYSRRQTGRNTRGSPRKSDKTNSNFIQSAKRQEAIKNYDEASTLYLRGNQVYSAAKMKAMKGPLSTDEAIQIVQLNAPDQVELITRNLVNEFYYRLEQPAIAASLLRSAGFADEAIAVEVAAGLSTEVPSQPRAEAQFVESQPDKQVEEIAVSTASVAVPASLNTDPISDEIPEQAKAANIQNTLMMASVTLADNCIVCRRSIDSGDSFLQCVNCGKPGHYTHVAEIVKVTGKCPNCKERLVMTMFDL